MVFCLMGYQLQGPDVIHCNKSSSQWDGPTDPLCIALNSSSPKHVTEKWEDAGATTEPFFSTGGTLERSFGSKAPETTCKDWNMFLIIPIIALFVILLIREIQHKRKAGDTNEEPHYISVLPRNSQDSITMTTTETSTKVYVILLLKFDGIGRNVGSGKPLSLIRLNQNNKAIPTGTQREIYGATPMREVTTRYSLLLEHNYVRNWLGVTTVLADQYLVRLQNPPPLAFTIQTFQFSSPGYVLPRCKMFGQLPDTPCNSSEAPMEIT
ncbi:hypothetical protein HOLleu_23260 [Holothuria leucospilota]|uniref:Sushi domain-containing protein n=1 Tax=Holothuria leucospilota TaxID=206669 RepID=A0A9Q1H527_HOLLE|nr:hypothetical protein HOLleu_23260 [Holothuria leucospilota]